MAVGMPCPASADALIRQIYGSVLEEPSLGPCLRAVGRAFGSHITAIHSEDLVRHGCSLEVIGEIQGAEFLNMANEYARRWTGQNLWIQRGMPDLLEKGYDTGQRVSSAELLGSEYYKHFLRPSDVRYGMGINVQAQGTDSLAILSLNRTARVGEFTSSDLQLVSLVRPHLINAYAICRRLVLMKEETTSLRASFDRLSQGVMVLNTSGQVLRMNQAASLILSQGNGIALSANGTIRIFDHAENDSFRTALGRLAAPEPPATPQVVAIGRRAAGGRCSLALHLCGFPTSAGPIFAKGGQVIAFLCELRGRSSDHSAFELLQMALRFTPMEAAVVLSLSDRGDPAQAAASLGLAISTVRSHLKNAFRKTGTSRQGELLRLVESLLSTAPRPS